MLFTRLGSQLLTVRFVCINNKYDMTVKKHLYLFFI